MLLDIRSQDLPNPILMSVEGGVYTVTTGTASLGIGLNAAKGTFAEVGGTATFGISLNAGRGTYTESAGTATFAVGLNASKGIYSEVGGQATFVIGLNAAHGTYAETGGTATLGIGLSISRGTYTESGGNVRFGVGMGVAGGIYTETGNPASLGIGLNAAGSTYTLMGGTITLGIGLAAGRGTYSETANAATLGIGLNVAGASYVETGGSATFVTGFNTAGGSYAGIGGSATFAIGLAIESGTFTESGGSVTFAIGLQVGGGTIAILGGPVTFNTALTSLGSVFSLGGTDVALVLSGISGILFGGFLLAENCCCTPTLSCTIRVCVFYCYCNPTTHVVIKDIHGNIVDEGDIPSDGIKGPSQICGTFSLPSIVGLQRYTITTTAPGWQGSSTGLYACGAINNVIINAACTSPCCKITGTIRFRDGTTRAIVCRGGVLVSDIPGFPGVTGFSYTICSTGGGPALQVHCSTTVSFSVPYTSLDCPFNAIYEVPLHFVAPAGCGDWGGAIIILTESP